MARYETRESYYFGLGDGDAAVFVDVEIEADDPCDDSDWGLHVSVDCIAGERYCIDAADIAADAQVKLVAWVLSEHGDSIRQAAFERLCMSRRAY